MNEGMLEVEGGRIWYEVMGDSGVPLLVLHGGPGATHDYLENLAVLSEERTVVLYDQLGSGHSDRPEDDRLWNVDRFVRELGALVDHLGLERFHLLGQSWGTMLAVLYANHFGQDRIVSMVLSAPYLSSDLWDADQRAHVQALPEATREVITDCEARGDFSSPAYAEAMNVFYRRHLCRMPVWPECLERTMRNMGTPVYNRMWGPSEFTLTGNLKGMDATVHLPSLRVPVLYTCGEFDEATPSTTRRYMELTPNSLMRVFPDASHMHHLESEKEFLHTVREFLDTSEDQRR